MPYLSYATNTGTNKSFISIEALHTSYKKQFINKKYRRVFLADGFTSIMIYGKVKLNIILRDMPTPINAFIVKDLCASCILGMDFINRYKLIINMRQQTVSVHNHNEQITLKINVQKDTLLIPARTINHTRIPPKHTVSVPVSIELESATVLVRPSYNLQRQTSLIMLNTALAINHHSSFISLHNPTTVSCSLPKGIILGTTTVPTLSCNKNINS